MPVTWLAVGTLPRRAALSSLTCALTQVRGPTSVMRLDVAMLHLRELISRFTCARTQIRGPTTVMHLATGLLLHGATISLGKGLLTWGGGLESFENVQAYLSESR
jgi:hypothetical protein